MIARGTVLVSGAREATAPVRLALEQLGGRIIAVGPGESLPAAIEHERPDVVVLPAAGVGGVLERALLRERHACALVGVLGAAPSDSEVFDVLVTTPPDETGRDRLRMSLLLGRARREAHDIGREVGRLREATSASVQRLTALLLGMLDRRHPGSTERAAHVAELALQVAERFGVPEDMLPALDLSARLREVGRLALPGKPESGEPAWEWSVTQATAQLLEPFPELAHAVELLLGVHENWDGTGHPGHLMSGQIPMRSRILRAAGDYLNLRAALSLPASQVLERMAEHAGTTYDPLVVVHLRGALESSGSPATTAARVYLPVPELQAGMVLAEDLYTDSGMKLLSRGTVLTAPALEVILRRHAQEPMYRGVAIQRRTNPA
ncbi:MAG: HD domain-containing phosphohydrolase [Candidatus Eisenbacteria bacterium]